MTKFVFSLAVACQAFAGEYAILQTGFHVRADRHEDHGAVVRLYTESGSMDLPAKDIVRFEADEYVPPQPAPPVPESAPPQRASDPEMLIQQAATKHGLRPEFVQSVAAVESAHRPDAISPKGAIGLMQLMPGTAKRLGANPHDPAENAEAGARYLKQLLLRYANTADPVRLALAAYNAGPGAVDRYGTVPPYRETRAYVERVLRKYLTELQAAGAIRRKS